MVNATNPSCWFDTIQGTDPTPTEVNGGFPIDFPGLQIGYRVIRNQALFLQLLLI